MVASILDRSEFDAWNAFTQASPQGSIFSTTTYLDACQADFDILACMHDDRIVGGMVLAKGKWGRHVNPPLCKYLGILLGPFEGKHYTIQNQGRKVQQALIEALGKRRGFGYMFHPAYEDWLPFHWVKYKQTTRYTYRIEGQTADAVAEGMHSRLRSKINKIEREGNYKILEDLDDEAVYELLGKTYANQGSKNPIANKWFHAYMTGLRAMKSMDISAISNEDDVVTAVLGIVCGPKAHYLMLNGLDHDKVTAGQNELLIYRSIRRAMDAGVAFDFEGSMMRNVESFYRQFGGILTPYFFIER